MPKYEQIGWVVESRSGFGEWGFSNREYHDTEDEAVVRFNKYMNYEYQYEQRRLHGLARTVAVYRKDE